MAQQLTTQETKSTPKNKPSLKYLRDKSREMVKGIFRYYEVPNGVMEFVYKEFKEDQVEKYVMYDGMQYTIPLGVARHLNKNGWYPEYEYVKGEQGLVGGYGTTMGNAAQNAYTMKITKKIRRFGFQSLEFLEIDDVGSSNKIQVVSLEA